MVETCWHPKLRENITLFCPFWSEWFRTFSGRWIRRFRISAYLKWRGTEQVEASE
jgi:hypothetical protein